MWLSSLIGTSDKAAAGRRLNFEVQSFKVDHWVIEDVFATEEEARDLVKQLLVNRDGMRIVRDFAGAPGMPATHTIIFSELRAPKAKPITVQPVEEAPVCTESRDYLQHDSRQIISRMLRQYLEEKALTASELLYNAGEMKRAINFENMIPVAVGRIATIQGKTTGQDARDRRDMIYGSLTDLRMKAEEAQKRATFTIKQDGFQGVMTKAETLAAGDSDMADYLSKVVLCRDLVQIRNLLGKVEWLLETAGDAGSQAPAHIHIIDTLVADALSFPSVIQDMLGRQPDLGTALNRILDILEGTFEPQEREMAPAITQVLSRWIAIGHAPQCRQVVFEGLLRSIKGTQPLARDPERNRSAYAALVARAMTPQGLNGGRRMAEALTTGYLRFLEQGGGEGRRLSIDGVTAMLPSGRDRAIFLAELAGTDLGQREKDSVLGRLRPLLGPGQDVNRLVGLQVPLKPKMQAMASLYRSVYGSGLPDAAELADRVDSIVADYIVTARVIEKLDDPSANLRIRATRLMQFAANDVLSSPKARKMVRDQIIGHLRQPNFDGKFVEGLNTPQEQAQALRNFYDLLRRAQFM
ncbi:hypothetical protein [Niveispirillum sp. BGYR6]|uniref:hypothetical protein n=1 Tax=Niveispirillum sp. BGYR6 TaxID=2971249 RepID=UPI0022B98304|nr:hypothetical protein [Niveispirillum sp. BGYR6]MDG5495574.1 hypothetical protein [Niveispirillum sp. BGYR6]